MEILKQTVWQMSFGERAALEGILTQLKPDLAIEIGTAEGGSLERIAAHSAEVHSFDLVAPKLAVAEESHVHLHPGDSHVLLPETLAQFAEEGRNVDFALVDGDHSADGVYRDLVDLLESPATSNTVILIHDVTNEEVRLGVDRVPYDAWSKVTHVELDWLPGYMARTPERRHELWGGIALVMVNEQAPRAAGQGLPISPFYPFAPLLAEIRDIVAAREAGMATPPAGPTPATEPVAHALDSGGADRVAALEARIDAMEGEVTVHRQIWRDMQNSASWRLTAPLRLAKRLANRSS